MRGLIALLALGVGLVHAQSNAEIEAASSDVWSSDSNRFSDADCQYNADGPVLFTYVNEAQLDGTYARMTDMFDNYNPYTGTAEPACSACVTEENDFLNGIMGTQPIQRAQSYLTSWGLLSGTSMRDVLQEIWFTPYTRSGGPLDSSGFEHIFVGEIKNNAVSGFHNWVRSYLEEKDGNFIYGNKLALCQPDIPKFSMTWLGYPKSTTSVFIRSSPEVELALYTMCFLARPNSLCGVNLDGNSIQIQTYTIDCSIGSCVGSSYPAC